MNNTHHSSQHLSQAALDLMEMGSNAGSFMIDTSVSDVGTEAESVFAGVKAKIDSLRRESKHKDDLIDDMKSEIKSLKRAEESRLKDITRQAEGLLKLQKTDFEHSMQRNFNRIEELIEEKRLLVKKLDEATTDLTRAEEACERVKREAEREQLSQTTKVKTQLALQDKKRRDKWTSEEAKKMKAAALKAIEPDISALLSKHKAELRRVREEHEDALHSKDRLLAEANSALLAKTSSSSKEVELISQSLRDEYHEAARKQQIAYDQKLTDLRNTHTYEKSLLEKSVDEERATFKVTFRELEATLRETRASADANSRHYKESIEERRCELRAEFSRKLEEEKALFEKQAGHHKAVETSRIEKEMEITLQEREAVLVREMALQRDADVEKIMLRMEEESSRMAAESVAERRALKEKLANATTTAHKAEMQRDAAGEEVIQLRVLLAEKEKDLSAAMLRRQREGERIDAERSSREEDFAGRLAHAETLIASKYDSKLSQLEADLQETRTSLKRAQESVATQKQIAENNLEDQREKHEEEIAAVQARVHDIVQKKDGEIMHLKVAAQRLEAKIKQTDIVVGKHKHLVYP